MRIDALGDPSNIEGERWLRGRRSPFAAMHTRTLLTALLLAAAACHAPATQAPTVEVPRADAPVASQRVSRAPAKTTGFAPGAFAFLETTAQGDQFLLLASGADADWRGGEPELISDPEQAERMARTEVDLAKLPAGLRLEGEKVDLYQGAELKGSARLGHISLISLGYDPDEPRQPNDPRPLASQLAEITWNTGSPWLVAEVKAPKMIGPGVTWGRLSRLPKPAMPTLTPVGHELEAATVARLDASSLAAEAQKTFDGSGQTTPSGSGRWDDGAAPQMLGFSWRGKDLVLGRVEAGGICAYHAVVAGLYERRPGGLSVLNESEDWSMPALLLDVDGDGNLEAVVEDMVSPGYELVQFTPGGAMWLSSLRPTYGCPC